jgi:hypothetical protein
MQDNVDLWAGLPLLLLLLTLLGLLLAGCSTSCTVCLCQRVIDANLIGCF